MISIIENLQIILYLPKYKMAFHTLKVERPFVIKILGFPEISGKTYLITESSTLTPHTRLHPSPGPR